MIKKLSFKFVLVFLVLVVSVFITSSCYAALSSTVVTPTFTKEVFYTGTSFISYCESNLGYKLDETNSKIICFRNGSGTGSTAYYVTILYGENLSDVSYLDFTSATDMGYFRNKNGELVTVNVLAGYLNTSGLFAGTWSINKDTCNYYNLIQINKDNTFYLTDITDYTVKIAGESIYQAAIDTSFDYTLNGIKRGQVELKIENLDSSLRMYGFVNIENSYNIGDTLNININDGALRLISMYSDNSDLSCTLYEGETLIYYIVDENNVILDIGSINELVEGYFLYGFPVSDGVDFVFLKDGKPYWDNNLTFKYQVNNADLLTKNEIVSSSGYTYIESNKTDAKIIYNGFVYDLSGEILSSATTSTSNDLSSFYIEEVVTYYYETKIGLNILIHDTACYWLRSISLAGTDSSGNNIDFSNYSVRWSIPTWLKLDSLKVGPDKYDKYNGTITGFSSYGYLQIDLYIYELLKNHTSSFDIKLEILDGNGDLVKTHVINSDDIVRDQIASEENNIDRPDYDIIDNPSYTGGSGNKDFSNIQNWKSEDYLNLMSTDNFVWEFFKAILGNLPWWITVPITILIFGVVIITLIRFARGA